MTEKHAPAGSTAFDGALAAHPDGAALQRVWHALPHAVRLTGAEPSADERAAAWSRLRTTIDDPSRAVCTSDVTAVLEISRDDAPERGPREARVARRVPGAPTRRAPAAGSAQTWRIAAIITAMVTAGGAGVRAVPLTYEGGVAAGTAAADRVGVPVRQVRLADGSDVWLAPGSRLSVPRAMGWHDWVRTSSRSVRLSGRAFFSVQRDGRAFEVQTTDATVRVLGTRFDVRSATSVSGTQVMVEEGRVSVASTRSTGAGADAAVELHAGQQVIVARGALPASAIRTIPIARVASWRTGGLAALDEPLDAVLSELATRYGVEITHEPTVDVTVNVSLFYPAAPPIGTVLGDLSTAQGLTFQRTSRGYHLARSSGRP